MLVVKPWIFVESCPGLICHTLCGVPGFSFSRTMGFGFDGAAVAGAAVAGAAIAGAAVGAGVMVFVLESNGRLIVFGVGGLPGITSTKSKCELCATPLGLNRSPAACAGVKL